MSADRIRYHAPAAMEVGAGAQRAAGVGRRHGAGPALAGVEQRQAHLVHARGDHASREVLRKLMHREGRLERLEEERVRLHDRIASLDDTCNAAYDVRWGPLFREGNELSRFGHQVRDFACIYTGHVTNLLHYPLNTYYRAPMERMPHER